MTKRALPLITLLLAVAATASASGFQLREQSASGQGNAFAGASAGAQDISSMYWNPAVLPLFDGTQVALGGSWIGVHMDLSNAVGTRAPNFQSSQSTISGPADLPNAVSQPILPGIYAAWSLNDTVSLGLSVNVPFGLVTNYPQDFIGRYYGLRSDLKTMDITPSVAFKAGSAWTLGVAFVARKTDATISNGVDFGAIGNANGIPGFVPGGADTVATLTGDAWSYGFKAGFTYTPSSDLRVGVGYQSAGTVKIKGRIVFNQVPPVFAGTFGNGPGDADLNLPATASAGFTYNVSPTFSLQGEAAWTGWSTFKELRVKFTGGMPDDVTHEDWQSTWFYSLGGIWKLDPAWSFKAGLAYDRSPVDNLHRTPRIPDADRTWVSLGLAWAASKNTTFDFGVTRLMAPKVPLNLTSGTDPSSANFYRGNLSGSYNVGATIIALSARFKF